MERAGRRWWIFAACALVALVGWGALARATLAVEERATRTRLYARHRDLVERALGRIDAIVTALVVGESARPAGAFGEARGGLAGAPERPVLLHFERARGEPLRSPNLAAELGEGERAELEARLAELDRRLDLDLEGLLAVASGEGPAASLSREHATAETPDPSGDYAFRRESFRTLQAVGSESAGGASPGVGPYVPHLWRDAEGALQLAFLRRVDGAGARVQGLWLDWPLLAQILVREVVDLLPRARLEPIPPAEREDARNRLASIPARLVAAPSGPGEAPRWSPARAALAVSFVTLLAALGSVGLLLRATIEAGERRRRFASAVTHELRTPLTTLCMYSDLLARDALPDEERRREYVATLVEESRRLRDIVEDVLAEARIEGGRSDLERERLSVAGLLDAVVPVLRRRAGAAGFELRVAERAGERAIETDPRAVERILANLVDNACKYARGSEPRAIELSVDATGAELRIGVRDHGPGVAPERARSVFEPFERGDAAARAGRPGLGLGLAIARGLARELGGELGLARSQERGARFELALPLARTSGPAGA